MFIRGGWHTTARRRAARARRRLRDFTCSADASQRERPRCRRGSAAREQRQHEGFQRHTRGTPESEQHGESQRREVRHSIAPDEDRAPPPPPGARRGRSMNAVNEAAIARTPIRVDARSTRARGHFALAQRRVNALVKKHSRGDSLPAELRYSCRRWSGLPLTGGSASESFGVVFCVYLKEGELWLLPRKLQEAREEARREEAAAKKPGRKEARREKGCGRRKPAAKKAAAKKPASKRKPNAAFMKRDDAVRDARRRRRSACRCRAPK